MSMLMRTNLTVVPPPQPLVLHEVRDPGLYVCVENPEWKILVIPGLLRGENQRLWMTARDMWLINHNARGGGEGGSLVHHWYRAPSGTKLVMEVP